MRIFIRFFHAYNPVFSHKNTEHHQQMEYTYNMNIWYAAFISPQSTRFDQTTLDKVWIICFYKVIRSTRKISHNYVLLPSINIK